MSRMEVIDVSSDDEYCEVVEEMLVIQCLFCDWKSYSHELIFEHIQTKHSIDFVGKCKANQLDTFQFFKLVNYIRTTKTDSANFETVLNSKAFDDDNFLKPFLEDDHFLMFDYDNEGEDEEELECQQANLLNLNSADLKKYCEALSKECLVGEMLKLKKQAEYYKDCMEKMRSLIDIDQNEDGEHSTTTKEVITRSEDLDSSYISSYSHFGIHHTMLADKPRTLSYKDAIIENGSFFKGKTILDVGCGTGILSLFAAQAGAQLVVAVDHSDIAYNAMDIVFENGFENIVKPIKGKLESIDFQSLNLPTRFDVIISEWMGYFLLFEGMLDTVVYARDKFLKPGGILLPSRSKMFISAFSDSTFYEKNIDFWKDVYGFKMSSLVKDVTSEVTIDQMKSQNICASTEMICELDISTCSLEDTQRVTSRCELKFEKDCTVHGLVAWFDCYFDSMTKLIILTTSPFAEETHWKQAIFPFKEPLLLRSGQHLPIEINIARIQQDARSLRVDILLVEPNLSFSYNLC